MFVSEANYFDLEDISLTIVNVDGETFRVVANPRDTVATLKGRFPSYFYKSELPIYQDYKMVLISNCKVLINENSIITEGLKSNDEILLIRKRSTPNIEPLTDDALKGPGQSDIDKVTAKLKEKTNERRHLSLESTVDYPTEIRKVIISIVEAAARVLAHTPQANRIIELMRERQIKKSGISLENIVYKVTMERSDAGRHTGSASGASRSTRVPAVPDPNVVAQMVDMGFSEEMVIRALRSRRMNQSQAVEWLLENSPSETGSWSTADDDEDDDVDLEDDANIPVVETIDGQPRWRESVSSDGQDLDQGHFLLGVTDEAIGGAANEEMFKQDDGEGCSEQQYVKSWSAAELLRSFDAFKKHQFRPSPKAMSALLEMGFAEDEVIEALKATGNSQDAACEWLLSDKKTGRASSASSSSSWEEADEGLDPNCPAFKAILAEPLVQLSLTNPKIILAYLSILETPSSTSIWINDIDVSPVLNQIFKTYSAEKYTLQTPEDESPKRLAASDESEDTSREARVDS